MLVRRREKLESKLRKQHVPWVTLRYAQHVRVLRLFNGTPMPRVKLGKVEVRRRAALRSARWKQLTKIFGLGGETVIETLQQTSGNMQAVLESTTAIAGSLQGVAGELMRFAESRAEQNLDHLNRLEQCRNLHDLLALQTQVVRDIWRLSFKALSARPSEPQKWLALRWIG